MAYLLDEERALFHHNLLADILTLSPSGVPSNSDKDSQESCALGAEVIRILGGAKEARRHQGQTSGKKFEEITHSFIKRTFPLFSHLRPGNWKTEHILGRQGVKEIARFDQYRHLLDLELAAKHSRQLAVALGNDYVIAPDIVVYRESESDEAINANLAIVSPAVATLATIRQRDSNGPVLHASISCKWTIRSDRSQNSRSEGLNLIRNRKGRAPHIAVVTGEPLPKRISSIAMGTGDIDCVYHYALPEIMAAARTVGHIESLDLLEMMVEGKRLKDIADLPLDLVG